MPGGGLFGRDSELALLGDALRGALGGTLHAVFIEGEGGIGKSTLLERTLRMARDLGFTVFLGEAEELEQGRPFRAIAQAMGCIGFQNDPDRAEIVKLLTTGSAGEAAFRLIDAFDELVEAEALKSPIVLAIDDLQWADPRTIGTLGSVTRRLSALPILIVGCLRGLPRSPELATLLRSTVSTARSISLAPLGEEAVQELARARLGGVPGPKLTRRLAHAGGTPFYVKELIESLLAESRISISDGAAEIADEVSLGANLRATILRRLSGLKPEDLQILRSAAILGSGFGIEEMAAVSRLPAPTVMQSVSDLRIHGVIEDMGERLRFRHDLIREAVYEELGEAVRQSMHRRAAQALTELALPASAVAPHLLRSGIGDLDAADTLIEASNAPGVDARSAAALLAAVLEAHPEHPRRALLASRLASFLVSQGRGDEAASLLLPLIAQTPDGGGRLRLMVRTAGVYMSSGRRAEAQSWGQRAAALAGELAYSSDSSEVLLAGEALFHHGELARGLALSERAVELAPAGEEIETEANNQCSWMSTVLLRPTAALHFSQQALALPVGRRSPYCWRHNAWALADLDRFPEAESASAVALDLAERSGMVWVLHGLVVDGAALKFASGRWDEALLDVQTAEAIAMEIGPGDAGSADAIASWIRYKRSDGQIDLAAPVEPTPLDLFLRMTMSFEAGKVDTAAREARERLELARALLPVDRRMRLFDSLPAVVRISLAAGDTETANVARDTAALLAKDADCPSVSLAALRCVSLIDGDASAARRLADMARRSPRIVLRAEALEDAALALDRSDAVDALIEARDLYVSMGATRDQNRVAARLTEFDVSAPSAPSQGGRAASGWEALTPTELEVVRLAAEGLTNREIGSRLYVSHRTVASHLSNVFAKLGLRSRVDLARESALHLPG